MVYNKNNGSVEHSIYVSQLVNGENEISPAHFCNNTPSGSSNPHINMLLDFKNFCDTHQITDSEVIGKVNDTNTEL